MFGHFIPIRFVRRRLLCLMALAFMQTFVVSLPAQQRDDERLLKQVSKRQESSTRETRRALVIGNNAYPQDPLRNAVNDAKSMAEVLRELEFQTDLAIDLNWARMRQTIDRFIRELRPGGVGLFYYAGHGVQIDGENYLIPVDFVLRDEADAKYNAYPASLLTERLEGAKTRLNIVILDACRNNPFRVGRSPGRGLAMMDTGYGMFIAFATGANRTASDNPKSRNGLFTLHLLEAMRTPELNLDEVFRRAREKVAEASGMKQIPWVSSSVIGEFYFTRSSTPTSQPRETRSSAKPELPSRQTALCEFVTVKVDATGREVERKTGQAACFAEDLGNNIKLEMVALTGGRLQMGASEAEVEAVRKVGALSGKDPATINALLQEELPCHEVNVTPFAIGKYEVTQAQWQAIAKLPKVRRELNPNPAAFKGETLPVDSVSWEDAEEFCSRLSALTGTRYRLPSEAEWEYACRAETITPFHFGEATTSLLLSYCGSRPFGSAAKGMCREQPLPVGALKLANAFGLYDMHGNLSEWCADDWQPDYRQASNDQRPRRETEPGSYRVLRGGSWMSVGLYVRSSSRTRAAADRRTNDQGFRVVAEIK